MRDKYIKLQLYSCFIRSNFTLLVFYGVFDFPFCILSLYEIRRVMGYNIVVFDSSFLCIRLQMLHYPNPSFF